MSQDSDQSGGLDGDQVLVAEYALGLLSAEEHARVAARLRREPALARELNIWTSRLASLDTEFTEVAPPATVLGRVETRLFGAPAATGLAGWWNSLTLWRGLAGAALAVAVVAVGINIAQPRLSPQDMASQLVAALKAEGSDVSFVALYNPATGSVRLTALSGAPVPEKDFELWAIEGENAPISMGVIPIDVRSEVKLPDAALKGFGEGAVLAITLEQKGGSPDGTPRGPIVAAGTATAI